VRELQRGKTPRPVIVRSIINLAHELGMEVVAEGAETEPAAALLSKLGCDFAQGFLFGEPMTADEARKLIQPAAEAPPPSLLERSRLTARKPAPAAPPAPAAAAKSTGDPAPDAPKRAKQG